MKRFRGRPRTDPVVRFWSKVEKTGTCWNWTDSPSAQGYGRLGMDGEKVLAHRFSWTMYTGENIDGMILDHSCGNRLCVNPAHLRVCSVKENNENLTGAYRNSFTGIRGVKRSRNGRPYSATVHHNGTRYYLGRFDSLIEAERAAVSKRLELFTHNEVDKSDALRLGLISDTTARDAVSNLEKELIPA